MPAVKKADFSFKLVKLDIVRYSPEHRQFYYSLEGSYKIFNASWELALKAVVETCSKPVYVSGFDILVRLHADWRIESNFDDYRTLEYISKAIMMM